MIHLNTREFTYDPQNMTFYADASTLEHEHPSFFDHDHISLQSAKTGTCKTFTFKSCKRDDGSTLYWEYKSEDALTIKIWNT